MLAVPSPKLRTMSPTPPAMPSTTPLAASMAAWAVCSHDSLALVASLLYVPKASAHFAAKVSAAVPAYCSCFSSRALL
ncbi:hypothetical protein DSECCO2_552100 [anaerobic digester metagenome]